MNVFFDILSILNVVFRILRVPIASFFLLLAIVLLIALLVRMSGDKIIRYLCRNRTADSIRFSNTQVVLNGTPLRRTILSGAVLLVPHGTKALVTLPPTGNPQSFQEGEHIIRFQTSSAYIQYIDIRRRISPFRFEKILTRDGYRIALSGKVSWKVTDEFNVVTIENPVQEILNEVEKAIRLTAYGCNHDQIVALPGNGPAETSEFITLVSDRLDRIELFKYIKVKSLILDRVKGDANRIIPPPAPTEAELLAKATKETLQNRVDMADLERRIAIHEAQIAQDRAMIANQIKLQQAETAVLEDNILHSIRERTIELELRREQPRLDFEREKIRFQGRMAAIAPATQIFTQLLVAAGHNGNGNNLNAGGLNRVLEDIIEGFTDGPNVVTAEYRDGPKPPSNAKEELIFQLMEVSTLEGFIGHNLLELPDGRWNLRMLIKGNRLEFVYNLSNNNPTIMDITITNSKDEVYRNIDPTPYSRLKLAQVIRKLLEAYDPH